MWDGLSFVKAPIPDPWKDPTSRSTLEGVLESRIGGSTLWILKASSWHGAARPVWPFALLIAYKRAANGGEPSAVFGSLTKTCLKTGPCCYASAKLEGFSFNGLSHKPVPYRINPQLRTFRRVGQRLPSFTLQDPSLCEGQFRQKHAI